MRPVGTWDTRDLVTLSEKNDEIPNPLVYCVDGKEVLDTLAKVGIEFDPDGPEWADAHDHYWVMEEARTDGPDCVLIFTDGGTYGVPAGVNIKLYVDDETTED